MTDLVESLHLIIDKQAATIRQLKAVVRFQRDHRSLLGCKCTSVIDKNLGDGCSICNPEYTEVGE